MLDITSIERVGLGSTPPPPSSARPLQVGCLRCGKKGDWYMVHRHVWLQALPKYQEVKAANPDVCIELCFDCLAKRLGRALTIADFTDANVNNGIRLGYWLGKG